MIYGRRWKRRRGVLGFWRELKQKLYGEYLREFHDPRNRRRYVPDNDPVPW